MPARPLVVKDAGEGKAFVTRRIGGETLIVPVSGRVGDLEAIYTLNEVGSRIWELIDGPTPVDGIVEAIRSQYNVSPNEATRDVLDFLSLLEERGLIRSIA